MFVFAAMIRRTLCIGLVLAAFFGGSRAEAQAERHFGLGLIVGHPTGLSLKGFLSPDTAIDGAIGFGDSFRHLHLHADYLWHFEVQRWEATHLQLYLGVGPELQVHTRPGPGPREGGRADFFLGARAPFGFSLMFGAPFDVFAELVAGLWFFEDPRVHIDAALGARYWF
jgi:hypothetical protein